jgi:signal transduction histidine kinase/ActR/RegA family two-component response regulator
MLETLNDCLPELILGFDRDCRCIYANQAARQNLGLDIGLAPEKLPVCLAGHPVGTVLEQQVRVVFATAEPIETEWESRDGAGQFDWRLLPRLDGEGRVHGVFSLLRDITSKCQRISQQGRHAEVALQHEREQLARRVQERTEELRLANAQLSRAARAKNEFLANMSHELRTPLNSIMTLAELLEEQAAELLSDEQLRSIAIIRESGQHLLSLINDILDIAKIEAGKANLEYGPVYPDELSQAALRMIRQSAHKKRIEVILKLDKETRSFRGDALRMKQVLVNLLSNAVKFTPAGGKIGLDVSVGNGEICFCAWDSGIGIEEQDIERMFEPFVQLSGGLSRQYEGTGLGLVLVRRLVHMHGGRVEVRSRPGTGSRFYVHLPLQPGLANVEPGAGPDARAQLQQTQYQDELVLLAEDNETNRNAVSSFLKLRGFKVIEAADGEDALAKACQRKPTLVLMDIRMPKMDGIAAISQMRAIPELDQMVIIVLTAFAMPADRERCLEAGANNYISKPISLRMLMETIETCLNERKKSADQALPETGLV